MKRTRKQNKAIKHMLDYIDSCFGDNYTVGELLAIVCDSLVNFTQDVEERQMRTMEITYNNFFSLKYNFDTGEYER